MQHHHFKSQCSVLHFICAGRNVDGAIYATSPKNVTATEGAKVTFSCETTTGSKIRWHYNSSDSKLPVVLYNGDSVVGKSVSVNTTVGWNELTITNVGIDASGIYTCHEVEKFSRNVTFQLEVEGIYVAYWQ